MNKTTFSFKRIVKSGYNSFKRNVGLSVATIFAMFLAIIIITSFFLLNPVSEVLISNIKEKISISIYFEEGVREEEILQIKEEIANSVDVREIEYISNDKAFERFVEKYQDNYVIMSSLAEIEINPFLSSLNIKANEISDYEEINLFLENATFIDLINKIDYQERRPVIEGIFFMTYNSKRAGSIISLFFGIIAVIFAFSSVKSAIYNSKEEISIMKLVGADNWFIKFPFLVQGAIIGFLSALFAFISTFLFSYFINDKIESFISGVSMFSIFISNIGTIALIQFGTGIILGIVSSFIAVRIHLSEF